MVEVALALVLLAGGGLLVSTVIRLNSVDTGFQPDEVVSMRLTLPWEEYDGPAIGAFFQDLEERVAAIPGVQSVGRGAQFPPINFRWDRVAAEGLEVVEEGQLPDDHDHAGQSGLLRCLGYSAPTRPQLQQPRCGGFTLRGGHQRSGGRPCGPWIQTSPSTTSRRRTMS